LSNILIIGASSGIGYATAKLLSLKHNVIAVARREDRLKEFKNYEVFDVSKLEDIANFIKKLVKKYGKFDALIYCAGTQNIKPLKVTKIDEAKGLFDINYFAPLFFAKSFSSKRIVSSSASIVFISSIAGFKSEVGILNYSASKAALNSIVYGLAKEIAPIRVNAIAPGFLETEMTEKFAHIYNNEFKDRLEREYPLGLGNVEDVANLVEFLISPKAKYITGDIIRIDGGGML
jgi:NAD(P)-dependent dehydrogenase (short-subunit alcohol dehydrogenase family)